MTTTANVPGLADLMPPGQVAKRVPGRPHPRTILRWMLRGVEGPDGTRVMLQHVRAGRQRLTTEAWLVAFFAAQTPSADQQTVTPARQSPATANVAATSARSAKRSATAARLQAAGFGRKRESR